MYLFRLSKIANKNNRDLTPAEHQKCKTDIIVFNGENRVPKLIDYILKTKG